MVLNYLKTVMSSKRYLVCQLSCFYQSQTSTPLNMRYLLTYMGVFDLAFVSSVLPQLPADCNKWGLLWKPSVTGSYWYPFLHVRLPPAIYLSTNLYGSLWFGLCLQCSPTAPSRLQQMGPLMKAFSHRIVLIPSWESRLPYKLVDR